MAQPAVRKLKQATSLFRRLSVMLTSGDPFAQLTVSHVVSDEAGHRVHKCTASRGRLLVLVAHSGGALPFVLARDGCSQQAH